MDTFSAGLAHLSCPALGVRMQFPLLQNRFYIDVKTVATSEASTCARRQMPCRIAVFVLLLYLLAALAALTVVAAVGTAAGVRAARHLRARRDLRRRRVRRRRACPRTTAPSPVTAAFRLLGRTPQHLLPAPPSTALRQGSGCLYWTPAQAVRGIEHWWGSAETRVAGLVHRPTGSVAHPQIFDVPRAASVRMTPAAFRVSLRLRA